MNSGLKNALYFLLGAAIGACGQWFAVSSYYRKKYTEEVAEMKDYIDKTYRNRPGSLGVTEESKAMVDKANATRVSSATSEKLITDSYRETIDKNKVSYNVLSENAPNSAIVSSEEAIDADRSEKEKEDMRMPYLITVEEYNDVEPYYDKVTLLYNKRNADLYDMQTNELMDPSDTIGEGVYNRIDVFETDTYIYVRNDSTSTDYEVEIRDIGEKDEYES